MSKAGCGWGVVMWAPATATRRKRRGGAPSGRWPAVPTRSSASTISSKDSVSKDEQHGLEVATMTRKQRRLVLIGGSLGVLAGAGGLVLRAVRDSIGVFNLP